jgi:ribosomal protein L11 methyltransferase
MTPRSYVEISIAADADAREHLVALLADVGIEGFWEDDALLRCYLRGDRWSPAFRTALEDLVTMAYRGSGSTRPAIDVREVADRNWNAEWEKTIRPLRVTERMVIRPSWHEAAGGAGDCEIIIDPKMSFGTGYHESTRLSLRLLERHVCRNRPMLDVGTGTGILAIAAVKLGASEAVAVDVDHWSRENAVENAALNGVAGSVKVIPGDLSEAPHGPFATICANIQRDVLESLLPDLSGRLEARGVLLLAGLLREDDAPMRSAVGAAGLAVLEAISENEWIALACGRPPGDAA